jgi:hypothetical protein
MAASRRAAAALCRILTCPSTPGEPPHPPKDAPPPPLPGARARSRARARACWQVRRGGAAGARGRRGAHGVPPQARGPPQNRRARLELRPGRPGRGLVGQLRAAQAPDRRAAGPAGSRSCSRRCSRPPNPTPTRGARSRRARGDAILRRACRPARRPWARFAPPPPHDPPPLPPPARAWPGARCIAADAAQLRLCSRARGAGQAAGGAGLTNKKYTEPYTGESYYVEAVAGAGGRRAQSSHILMHDAMYDKARPRERTAASHACVRATRPW